MLWSGISMASNLHLIHVQICKPLNPLSSLSLPTTSAFPFSFPANQKRQTQKFNIDYRPAILTRKCRTHLLVPHSALSSSSPPKSKEESTSQAKTCLSNCLEKPINNLKLAGKLKKSKQPRFRVEIPLVDDSPASLSQLAFEVFGNLPIKRKGSVIKVLILWPNLTLAESAVKVFESCSSNQLQHLHLDIPSVISADCKILSSSDFAVFLTPDSSQLEKMKMVAEAMYPKPVVIFNPKWMFEDEGDFGGMSSFVRSFEVIYSFMGLEVRGILNKRKGAIFKCVRDGVLSGEKWNVFVEEEELKLVSKFSSRPSIAEVENVLYNMMAMNSPITKSAKFLRGLVSNVTGKK